MLKITGRFRELDAHVFFRKQAPWDAINNVQPFQGLVSRAISYVVNRSSTVARDGRASQICG